MIIPSDGICNFDIKDILIKLNELQNKIQPTNKN
jgi:hypothetical protein